MDRRSRGGSGGDGDGERISGYGVADNEDSTGGLMPMLIARYSQTLQSSHDNNRPNLLEMYVS